MKRAWMIGLAAAMMVGCSKDGTDVDGTDAIVGDGEIAGEERESEGDAEMSGAAADAPASGASDGASSGGGTGVIQAGTLTAGVWDDNRNFDLFLAYRATMQNVPGVLPFSEADHRAANAAVAAPGPKSKLDVSLVIDTTGSMGDEIAYLQREFDALASTIEARFPGSEQHWSLVVYKDTTDEYVVRWFDFRASPAEFKTKLAAQSAGGGGDMPEAPDQALQVAHRLSWRPDANTAKVMFWVADAPHHGENAERMATAIRGAQSKGIHVYPVASSGVDPLAEHAMRAAAQLTGGRYVFLTDDSGVGNAHAEPHVPCYFVTKLDRAILRVVDIEMSGQYREPTAEEVVRKGGDPQNGACRLASGVTAHVY